MKNKIITNIDSKQALAKSKNLINRIDKILKKKGGYAVFNIEVEKEFGEYVEDRNQISKKLREQKNYTCQICGFRARNTYEQRFIHTHHTNGDLANNTKENLKVLCIKCHSEVDLYHTQVKSSDNYREFMNLLEKDSK